MKESLVGQTINAGVAQMLSVCQSEQLLRVSGLFTSQSFARRRVLAIAVVVLATSLFPRSSQAEFISASGQLSALPQRGQAALLVNAPTDADVASLDVSWGLFGWGSSSDQREQAAPEKPPVDENRRPLDAHAVSDLANSGGWGTSSPPTGATTCGCLGILDGSRNPWLPVCSGKTPCHKVLTPPSLPPSSLLDPPKEVAGCQQAGTAAEFCFNFLN